MNRKKDMPLISKVEERAWDALATCFDPEIPVNVVDLGLIYSCEAKTTRKGGYQVVVEMTLTSPGCEMAPLLVADIEERLKELPHVEKVLVKIVFEPPWDPEMMSDMARLELGL